MAVLSPERTAPAAGRALLSPLRELLAQPRRALLAAVLLGVGAVGFDALSDPDVWWHIRQGQWILANHRIPTGELFSYTAAGNPLTAHEWLSDSLFALLNGAGGLALLSIVVGLACWSGFVAIALRARAAGAGPLVLALGLALGAKAAEPVLGTRPQVLTFALLCWTLLLAGSYLRSGGRRVYALPVIFLLWANLHAGFIAGLAALGLVLAVELGRRRFDPRRAVPAGRLRVLGWCTAAGALLACVNPAGPGLYRFALTVSASEGQKGIVEWLSPNFHDPGMWALLILIAGFVVLAALGGRPDVREGVLAAAGVALALTAVRDTALCVALATPAWIAMAAAVGGRRGRAAGAGRRVTPAALAVGAVVVAAGGAAAATAMARTVAQTRPAAVAAAYPACAAGVLAASPVPQRVFAPYGSGGYLVYRLYPQGRVYEYGESISLGFTVFSDYLRIAAGAHTAPSALQLLQQSGTTAVLYPKGELTAALDAAPGWTRVLRDPTGALLYLRGDASWVPRAAGC
jgi:hypothetical protein